MGNVSDLDFAIPAQPMEVGPSVDIRRSAGRRHVSGLLHQKEKLCCFTEAPG